MVLIAILIGTIAAGVGSVWLAALLSFGVLARYTQHMLSLAAGALLATAFLHLLPEAFESDIRPQYLFATLLVGLVLFFVLEKAELWHHAHENHAPEALGDAALHNHAHHHHHGHGHAHGGDGDAPRGWALLAGDSVHAFGDGILIASAFMADLRLGFVAALAVMVHEVPHHMGDLIVLRQGSNTRRVALVKVSMAGAVTALGGVLGYALLDQLTGYLPFFLVMAASSFVYVALADLIPQLQKKVTLGQTMAQVLWLLIGMGLVMLVGSLAMDH